MGERARSVSAWANWHLFVQLAAVTQPGSLLHFVISVVKHMGLEVLSPWMHVMQGSPCAGCFPAHTESLQAELQGLPAAHAQFATTALTSASYFPSGSQHV